MLYVKFENCRDQWFYRRCLNTCFQVLMDNSRHTIMHAHTCDKFQNGIREVFLSFPGGF